ncbi:hypothetical protein POF50_007370 [Streptomyces sp. SL13]|uniref:Integrase catalytic domain-containing protein n=1 Tax=Streptantibioticus silvisoli TaxID=2705255 RepID=A0AA90KFP7_9ACTN|nr:hypothetical protein [Streptantibioticus silvisoli]MDI5969164.1 hypothetical protein [Streptantibioticus silvisoli]
MAEAAVQSVQVVPAFDEVVIDITSRRVVGWATADQVRTDPVATCRQRRPTRPVIFPSDRESHYTSWRFAALAYEVRLSVGHTGQCWDHALAESFFAAITREALDTTAWPSRTAARTAIFGGQVEPAFVGRTWAYSPS